MTDNHLSRLDYLDGLGTKAQRREFEYAQLRAIIEHGNRHSPTYYAVRNFIRFMLPLLLVMLIMTGLTIIGYNALHLDRAKPSSSRPVGVCQITHPNCDQPLDGKWSTK